VWPLVRVVSVIAGDDEYTAALALLKLIEIAKDPRSMSMFERCAHEHD